MNINRKYKNQINYILKNGITKEVRAKWDNGKNAITKSVMQYSYKCKDILNDFPIISYRKIFYKTAIKEILWIYQKNSNVISELGSKIWDSWEYKNTGTIGHSYGYIVGKEYKGLVNKYPNVFGDKKNLNQIENLFQTLIDNPNDRRMIINLFDNDELCNTNLPPCAFQTLWGVNNNKLYLTLIQRSGDSLVASSVGNHNCVQYSFLLSLVAKSCGLEVGTFHHLVMDAHIYDRHWTENDLTDYLNQFIDTDKVKLKLKIKNKINENDDKETKLLKAWDNFKSFQIDDFKLENYNPKDYKLKLEVAV